MNTPKRHTITAALPYANGPLHIGHIAGAYLPADIYVRYLRLKGEEVAFICGSDEHGAAITLRAKKEGISPKEIVDKYHEINKKAFENFGMSFDIFSRTSSQLHHETASQFFLDLYNKGVFIEKTSEQFFDIKHQQFLADRYIKGTCPNCGYTEAYGDQCEKCGKSLSPNDLINPISTLSGEEPVLKETKHWYLPLENFQDELSSWILLEHKKDWKINVYGQCKSWLEQGLQPRAITRDLDWGVPVPLDEAKGKVLYVWLDAPIGYITATKEWAQKAGKDWKLYWQDKDTRLVHFIGKDNIVFHCIIFPAILMAHGDYILPDNVPANEFLNLEGAKISTSRDHAVWLHEYLEDFPGKQDVLRYVLCSIAPETKDSEFTWKDFQARNNSELVAIFGNFVNRAMVLTQKYFDGHVPERGELTDNDKKVLEQLANYPLKIEGLLELFRFREAQAEMMNLARLGNKYLADEEPWHVIKTDEARVKTILNIALEITANLSILVEPFLPFAAKKLHDILNIHPLVWDQAGRDYLIPEGHKLGKAELLFQKIEDDVIEQQLEKLRRAKEKNAAPQVTAAPVKEEASFDDFTRLDIRTGTVTAAEKVPKADKLLKLTVDIGTEKRTVVSGIAEHYSPENIIGQKVTILINLQPRKIRGVESQGMILMAENDEKLVFVSPSADIDNGATVR